MEAAGLRVIRERLALELGKTRAQALLFEAMQRWGGRVPASLGELTELVTGPLSGVLLSELGEVRALQLANELGAILRDAPTDAAIELPEGYRASLMHVAEQVTQDVPTPESRLRVLVLSAGTGFADHLGAVFGADLVPTTASRLEEMALGLADVPDVVLVDGSNPPFCGAPEIAAALSALPSQSWCAVWAVNLPFGGRVRDEIERRGTHSVPLHVREGIAPLIDLLRARGAKA